MVTCLRRKIVFFPFILVMLEPLKLFAQPAYADGSVVNEPVLIASCRSPYKLEFLNANRLSVCVSRGDLESKQLVSYNPCPGFGGSWGNELANGMDRCVVYGQTLPAAPCPINTKRMLVNGDPDKCYRFYVLRHNVVMKAQDVETGMITNSPSYPTQVHRNNGSIPNPPPHKTVAAQCPYSFTQIGPHQGHCFKRGKVAIKRTVSSYELCKSNENRFEDNNGVDRCRNRRTGEIAPVLPCSGNGLEFEVVDGGNDRCYKVRYENRITDMADVEFVLKNWEAYVETHRLHE
jgi:hypothetical protein